MADPITHFCQRFEQVLCKTVVVALERDLALLPLMNFALAPTIPTVGLFEVNSNTG